MAGRLKGDIINDAYAKLRISGLTSQPTPEDLTLALDELENLAEEMLENNICVGYNFEDEPDPNSLHNVKRKFWSSLKVILASRLIADFNKVAPQALLNEISRSWSFLYARTAKVNQVQYSRRMARGSGNTLKHSNRFQRFYRPQGNPPNECATNFMYIGNIDNFVEHFDAWLDDGETIASYTLSAESGLAITAQSLSSPDINYTVRADGTNAETSNNWLQIVIKATSSAGRIETRVINFQLHAAPDVN